LKLIISEKEIAAKRIANILSGNGVKEEKVYGIPVHSLDIDGTSYKVIGLKGHILQVDFPKEYSNWFKVDPANLIDADIEKIPIHKRIIQALGKLSQQAEEVIIATDYDREGELIGYDAYQVVKGKNTLVGAKRAKFSALTKSDLENAFQDLDDIDTDLAFAGSARQDIDLIWGAVLTRFISLASYQVKENFLSVGRVQSPTLALVVDRELEIKDFTPTPYWVLNVLLKTEEGEGFEATHKKKKFLKKEEAKKIFEDLAEKGTVSDLKETVKKVRPPAPLNTTALIVSANAIGFTAARTINTAENLYMNGYISYPRTDNTVYPSSLDLRALASNLLEVKDFKGMAEEVLKQEKIRPTRGKKRSTDHPPIYPTGAASKSALKADEWKLYELISRRFAATLLPEARMKSISVKVDISGETFTASGSNIIESSWIKHYPYYKHKDVFLPELIKGQELEVAKKEMLDKETKPPARYSQGKLVEKMEELGLGTKATRHSIIQSLISRRYIGGNPLIPSERAIAVVSVLKKHAEKISTPDMTAELELDMDGISKGDETKEEVVEKSKKILKEIIEVLEAEKAEISKEIKDAVKEDNVVGSCPREDCKGNLIIRTSRRTKKRFIGCSAYPDCNQTFPLPQSGLIVTTKDKCKHCGHPIIKVIKKGKRPWELCVNNDCPAKDEKYKKYKNKK